jgi:methionine aminopeptidase
MSVETQEELRALQAAGRVVAETIRAMRRAVAPGVTTAELDRIAARVFARAGARSGPQLDYGFPGVTCISVNDEAVHGIPGRRRLRSGDLVKLDVTPSSTASTPTRAGRSSSAIRARAPCGSCARRSVRWRGRCASRGPAHR